MTCGRHFSDLGNARRHFRLKHMANEKAICHICGKSFVINSVLPDGFDVVDAALQLLLALTPVGCVC